MKVISSLQAMRGIAAIAVTMHHAAASTTTFVGQLDAATNSLANFGLLGVDFFFVLSGFIILNSHFDDASGFTSLKAYGLKRLIRIFSPYLPISLLYVVCFTLIPTLGARANPWGYWSSLLLIPTELPPVLLPAWTLVFELLFYCIFLIWFVARSRFVLIMSTWFIAILLINSGSDGEGVRIFV